jgi:hypothetical protein
MMGNSVSGNGANSSINFIHFQNNSNSNLASKPNNIPSNFIDLSNKFIVNNASGSVPNAHAPHSSGTPLATPPSSLMLTNQQKSISGE